MSDFDLAGWYGIKDRDKQGTRFPKVPPPYRSICDKFAELWTSRTGQEMGPWLRKQMFPAARDWYSEHGETPDLLERAFISMEKKGLIIATPRSCIREGYALKSTAPEICPHCGMHYSTCLDEWGAQERRKKYG